MTVLLRLDAVLEPTKQAVLDMKASLAAIGVVDQKAALRDAVGQAFYNTSKFTLKDLRARASRQQLRADFEDYLDGFSPSVQDILDNFEFRNQIPRLSTADALGSLIEKLTSPEVNLSPDPVMNTDGAVRHPGLDNHGMGTVFEELIRRFNEKNNEEAGEHFTPRDAVKLMANLVFLPVADQIESGTYQLYDGACGTGGMLTVAEDVLQQIAQERGKQVSTHLFGQEINAETYAICKADLLLKGEGEPADNIVGGPAHSTLSNDAFPSREFDFILSNRPYGKSWKTGLHRMGGKRDMRDLRFVIEHADDPEYSLVTRSSDGQMLFLANKLSRMKLSEERREEFFDPCIEEGEVELGEAVHDLGDQLGAGPHRDFNRFLEEVREELPRRGVKMTAKRKSLLQAALAERDEAAEPVVKKVHRLSAEADPIRGLFEVGQTGRTRVVETEPDVGMRDTEQIPLQEVGGIGALLWREVLPYALDAWYVPGTVKIGYEISFNRYFCQPEAMRTLEEIQADIVAVEDQTAGLLTEIISGVTP